MSWIDYFKDSNFIWVDTPNENSYECVVCNLVQNRILQIEPNVRYNTVTSDCLILFSTVIGYLRSTITPVGRHTPDVCSVKCLNRYMQDNAPEILMRYLANCERIHGYPN